MDIYEYQAKTLLAEAGVPVAAGGDTATDPDTAGAIAGRLGGKVVVKAQVLTGGRGKAGGIKVASSRDEASAAAAQILGMDIRGHTVRTVLVEPAADVREEIYLGIALDRAQRRPVVMTSRQGGVDIEAVASRSPESIIRATIQPLLGCQPFVGRALGYGIGLEGDQVKAFGTIVNGLWEVFSRRDATLVEVNPLVITGSGAFMALDAKVTIDDNALYRQPALRDLHGVRSETDAEAAARAAGLSYVDLDGSIGCLVNGAGLAMATMDVIKFFGGEPANFLDIGGGAQADKVEAAMRIILRDERVKSVLINIFGGITRGDEVARGILEALGNVGSTVPMVVRIVGTNAEAAREILASAHLPTARTLAEAAQLAVAASRGAPRTVGSNT